MRAQAAAWALLTGGWIVLAHAADRLAPGAWQQAALLLGWLLALTVAGRGVRRAAWAPLGAVLAAAALAWAVDGGGWWALWPALLAWAATIAWLAPPAGHGRPALVAAALGAFAAWAVLGDPTDLRALVPRAALLLAGATLVALSQGPHRQRRQPAGLGCLAFVGAPDGSPWPLRLAALAMLPMMAGLPQMLALCRSDSLGPAALLGLHLAAMFLPGLCLPRLAPRTAARLGLALLALAGALAALHAAGPAALGPTVALGAAWSLAARARRGGGVQQPGEAAHLAVAQPEHVQPRALEHAAVR